MEKREEILQIFSVRLRNIISCLQLNGTAADFEQLQEIRLRVNEPLLAVYRNREYFVKENGVFSSGSRQAHIVSKNEMRETLEYIGNYSLYAFEDEIRQGFITIQGGHRIGIAGHAVLEAGQVKNIKHISFINIRLSHQVKGCADKVIPYITVHDRVYHTLIISPPRCGKTTLLRDIIRQLSDGDQSRWGMTVGVVDERSEIGACYLGVPQNDLGMRTDILDCCPKADGMLMLIRSMSPAVIAVDEIGQREDLDAIEYVMNCGCCLVATVHGSCIDDVKLKPVLGRMVKEKMFERYIILNNKKSIGNIEEIYDDRGTLLYKAV